MLTNIIVAYPIPVYIFCDHILFCFVFVDEIFYFALLILTRVTLQTSMFGAVPVCVLKAVLVALVVLSPFFPQKRFQDQIRPVCGCKLCKSTYSHIELNPVLCLHSTQPCFHVHAQFKEQLMTIEQNAVLYTSNLLSSVTG